MIDHYPIQTISIFILIIVSIVLIFNFFPNIIKDNFSISAVAEINALFYFLSGVGTILLVYVAYKEIGPINKTAKAEFLLRIDKRWNSKEITETRKELWKIYRKAKRKYKSDSKDAKNLHGIAVVGQHIVTVHESNTQTDLLFDYLNFMELLGTINYIQEEQLIDEDFIENIFGRKLRTYVEFYEKYFEKEFGYIYNSTGLCS